LCHQQRHSQEKAGREERKQPEAQGSCSHPDLVLGVPVFGTSDGSDVFVVSFLFCIGFIAD
jgi:hypothetical protein